MADTQNEPSHASLVSLTAVSGSETMLSVIVPCYNEQDNLPSLVTRIMTVFSRKRISGNIVLVDDCSTDKTVETIRDLMAKYPGGIIGSFHEKNAGIAHAWRTGLRGATGTFACFIDADLQHPPEEIYRLYREIIANRADVIQGVRSTIGRVRDSRYVCSRGLNWLLNMTFGMKAIDNKSGFVMARRDALIDILNCRYQYSYYNSFITVAAKSKGYSIYEVETLFVNRNAGQSYMRDFPVSVIAACLVDMAKAAFEFRFSRSSQDIFARYLKDRPVHNAKAEEVTYRGWRKLRYDLFFATMPLHKWLITSNAKTLLKELRQTQWLKPAEIHEFQEMRLRRLVQHAYLHVPYYRATMNAAGVRPEDIRTLDDFRKMPMLTKQDIREYLYFDLFSDMHDKAEMLKINTSGSTGSPLVTYAERSQLEMRFASTWRAMEWTGWRLGDRCARLWHQTLGMSWSQVMREYIDAFFQRRLFIPAYEMRESNIYDFVARLAKHKPVLIDGYAESFNFLAHFLNKNEAPAFQPRAIMSSAQIMPEQVRKVIEEKFRTKVYDKYGSREFSGIAYECSAQDGHHVMAESYIVEIIKDNRPALPGEIGEIVITDLNNLCVPLIRYRIGDLAVAMDNTKLCACGRGLPRIGHVIGRTQAMIVCANGTWLPGAFFLHLFKDYDYAIRQFQIVQTARGAFELKIVKADQFSEKTLNVLLEELKKYTGPATTVSISYVDTIPMVRTGKRSNIVSHLNLDFQKLADEGIDDGKFRAEAASNASNASEARATGTGSE